MELPRQPVRGEKETATQVQYIASVRACFYGHSGKFPYGREILASTPEGKKLGEQFKDTLVREQTYSGIVSEVRDLLNEHLPNHKVL